MIIQRFVDRHLESGMSVKDAFQQARWDLCQICEFDWDNLTIHPETRRVEFLSTTKEQNQEDCGED